MIPLLEQLPWPDRRSRGTFLSRISEVFGVSIDYLSADESKKLVKDEITDKTLVEYIAEIEQMSEEEKKFVKFFLDAVLLRHKRDKH